MIESRTGARVHVENDVNAAALGTFTHLGLAPGSSLAYVNVGTGIAAGFVLDGQLLRGATGAAGEIGHVPMWPDGPPCPCGQRGCAEAIGSGRAAASDGSRRTEVAAAVAWTVQLAIMTLDVDVVAVGGGMSERPGFLDDLVAVLVQRESTSPMLAQTELARRVRLVPADVPLGSLGAVLAARSSRS
jgi:predicted NBD/HSP70 family sugar kinase